MRLASDPITITVDGVSATLRPSLRAAYNLERRHGMVALYQGVIESNLSVIADLLDYGSDDTAALAALFREIHKSGVAKLNNIKPALISYIGALIGVDPDDEPAKASSDAPTLAEFFESCFEIGTGWLGWTPETTWNATPAEIIAAQRGLVAFRNALRGSTDEQKPVDRYSPERLAQIEEQGFDPAFDRDGLRALSGTGGR